MSQSQKTTSSVLRNLPAVDQLLNAPAAENLNGLGPDRLKSFARQAIDELRSELQLRERQGEALNFSREELLGQAIRRLDQLSIEDSRKGLRRVINATGVILHTNLGRAPLSEAARDAVMQASGYCTLEYDTVTGARGRRAERVEDLLKLLTGAEDALVVNNCASAALLVLTTLAHNGETVVSRGELVEIGGDFRVPDVLANSGTRMVEVGTTNRTKITDYRRAINEETRLIMRIHPSNYRIVGFTASPGLIDLSLLAREYNLPLYEDAGSGVLRDLGEHGLVDEPIIRESIAAGADVVSFSGDKLLGSAQAGIIVGSKVIVGRLRQHSLYRALRADKLCLAALEATLEAHTRGTALADIPALQMLATSKQEVESRALHLLEQVNIPPDASLKIALVKGESAIGGGSAPNTHPETVLIALTHESMSANDIESRLRRFSPPVITRIAENQVLLDLRTVETSAEKELVQSIKSLLPR